MDFDIKLQMPQPSASSVRRANSSVMNSTKRPTVVLGTVGASWTSFVMSVMTRMKSGARTNFAFLRPVYLGKKLKSSELAGSERRKKRVR